MSGKNIITLLLVEDEAITATLEKKQLEGIGYAVNHVLNGEDAVQTALGPDSDIDLILMDIDLGSGIDGTQAAQEILKQKDIPIVFLSSHTEPEIVEKTEKITSYGYVVKNSGIFVLDTSIKMALKLFDEKMERKKAEEKIRESENKMQSIYRVAPTGIGLVINRVLKEVNPRICDMTGYTREELIEKNAQILYPTSEEYEYVGREKYEQIRKTGTGEVETLWKKKDGSIINVLLASTPIDRNDYSRGVTFTALNITDRKQAEEALRESEELLNVTQQIAKIGGWVYDTKSESMTWADETYRIHGMMPGELTPGSPDHIKRSIDCYDKKDREIIESAFRRCVEDGTPYTFEFPITTVKGEQKWILTSAQAVLGSSNVTKVYGHIMDITERKKAEEKMRIKHEELDATNEELNAALEEMEAANEELIVANNELERSQEALKESEERFRSIYNSMAVGVARVSLDFCIVNANQAYCKMLGYTENELIGKNLRDITDPEVVEENMKKQRMLAEGQIDYYRMEKTFIHKNGFKVFGLLEANLIRDINGTPNFFIGSIVDITERKQAEEELKQKTVFLSTLMETSPVGITTVDKTGNITYANKRAEEILGLVKDEITVRSYDAPLWNHTDLDGSPLPDEKQPFNIVKTKMSPAYNIQHGITWPGGTVVILSINATPLKDNLGNFDGMLATIEDITENKKHEDTIVKQLKEKETLLKEVHHRIKNSVSQIEGFLLIQAGSTDNADVERALQEAVSRVQGIRLLYEKLLISRDYQNISVKYYIESLIDSLMTVFPESRNITIEKHIADFEMSTKKVIPVGIVVNELLTNVFKYAFKETDDNHVFIKFDRKGTHATLIIQDNGIGINEQVLKKETSGFGLILVQMLAEQLGGTYAAENNNGTKSVLKFEI